MSIRAKQGTLSNQAYLDHLESSTPEGLNNQLAQIMLPFTLRNIVYDSNKKKYVAFLSLTKPIKKTGENNGTTS